MPSCGLLNKGSTYDCDEPLQGGVDADVILFNKDDVASITRAVVDGANVITDITLKNGKIAYEFQGFGTSVVPNYNQRRNQASVTYDHVVQLQVYEVSQAMKNALEKAALGKMVGIVKNQSNTTLKNFYEVYGLGNGLMLTDNPREPANIETGGSFTCIFRTDENQSGEGKMPETWFDTDEATTTTLIRGKLHLPVVDNISPVVGVAAGGDSYTITGLNFQDIDGADDVTSLDWVDSIATVTNQAAFTIDSNTQISIATSIALAAGTYKIRVTTSTGIAESALVVVIS